MAVMKLDRSASEVFLEQAIKEGRATRQELSIKSIVIDHDLQSRVEMDMDHVKRLASFMDTGIDLRPVVVFRQEKPFKQWLSDGFHRVAAHKARRSQSIVAWVILSEDAKREALLYSVSANIENSKPTTAEDRKKSVFMLLNYESLLRAWGHIRAFRLKEKPSCRAVVICYPPDELRQLIDLARRDGVEFLTPEEVVAEFGPGSSSGE